MTKAESADSRTQKTHFADDETLAHIAALELEAADLRSCIKDLRERLAKAQKGAERYEIVRQLNVPQFSDLFARNLHGEGLFDDLVDALAHPKGEDHGGENAKQHQWSEDGERCLKCGDKDWMGGPCNG